MKQAIQKIQFLFIAMILAMGAVGQDGSVSTNPPLSTNNGQGGITFNVSTNTAVVIDTVWCAFYGSSSMTVYVWYSQSAINGAPTISTGNGWTLAGTATLTPLGTSSTNAQIQQVPVALNIPMGANETYGFWVGNNNGSGTAYTTYVSTNQTVFTDGVVSINTGPNVGYGGNIPNPTFTVRQFNGRVVYSKPIIDEFPYCQSFEFGEADFVGGGILSTWEHGEPNNTNISSAYSFDNAWVTDLDGDHNNDEASYVRSPRIDLTSLVDPTMRFYCNYDLQNGQDGVQMQISQDSAATWSVLGSSSSASPWYNSGSISALSSLGNGNGWTGSSSGWEPMQHSLVSYTNDTAFFVRWLLAADGNTTNEGYGFDDIVIAESNDVAITGIYYPDSACGYSGTPVTASICNISVVEKSGFDIVLDTNGTSVTYSYPDTLPVCGCDTVELLTINTSAGGTWTLEAEVDNSGDVNAANDTVSGVMHMFGTPGAVASGFGSKCEGQADTVTFTFEGTAPWSLTYTNGANTQYLANITQNPFELIVTQSGVYEPIFVTDASGCPADTSGISGQAVINFYPAPEIDLGPDSSVCEGYVLNAGAGYSSYNWSTGQNTQSIAATTSSVISVTVTDSIGCTGTDVVDLEVFPAPVVNLTDTVLCEGSSFLFNAGGGAAGYLWHDGTTGQVFQIDSVGTVSVTVTSFFGCEDSATASITAVVPNPTPSVTSTSSIAPVTLDAGSGYIAYLWSNNATTQTISVSVPGTYTCTVTDANGCKGSDDKKAQIWPNGVDDLVQSNGIAIYPNPANDLVNIRVNTSEFAHDYFAEIMDQQGRVLRSMAGLSGERHEISISDIPAGVYMMRISDGQHERVTSFTVVH